MHDKSGALNKPELAERSLSLGYALQSTLGAGGYGTVFLATQARTNRQVAFKVVDLAGDSRRLARFHRETALCASLNHPHIVQLLDKGEIGNQVYGVFEYVPGETLKHLICRKGALSASETGQIMMEVLDALDCAHQAGIVHRDLKPDNVMITTTGLVPHAKVLDFGISTVVPQARDEGYADLTMTQEFLGTPAYSAPEQLRGEPPTVKSDLYAWGLMFLECLTGAPVMQGASAAEIYHQQLSAHEISLPHEILNHPVASILRRALRKNPVDRSESARALLQEMQQIRLDDLVGTVRCGIPANAEAMAVTVASKRAFAEKRMVTVLSCGVTVWPGEGKAIDPEELELLQRQAFDQFVDTATRRGGLLAGRLGDRMLLLFGYPHVSDTDARRAGMTAEDLLTLTRQQSEPLERLHGAQLIVRGGLHTGAVIVSGGETPSGHTVNVAMQLENAAAAGEILASEEARQALGRGGSFDLKARAGLHMTPRRTAYAVHPPTIARARIVDDTRSGLKRPLGRHDEVEVLMQVWQKALAGEGQAVLLKGEAGIGKSSLVDFMASQADNEGMSVLRCQCLPELQNNALSPVIALLRQEIGWTGHRDAEEGARARLRAALGDAGCTDPELLPIFCSWVGLPLGPLPPSQISPQMQKALFVQTLGQWLLHHADGQPAVVVMEDLHWADPTTMEWLTLLSESWPARRVLILMTGRPEYTAPTEWPVRTLPVRRLDDEQAADLVRQLLSPDQVDDTVISNVVSRTDGVPLFIQELARMLRDTQLEKAADGVWHFRLPPTQALIPVSLQDSLLSRFDRLGAGKALLQVASVIGRQFDLALLEACADMSQTSLGNALGDLREAGLIRHVRPTQDAFEFRHALIRDAAYDCMVSELACEHHGRVAREMLRLNPQRVADEPDSVARHFAKAGDADQAVHFGLQQLSITQHRSLNDATLAYAEQVNGWIERMRASGRQAARLEVSGYVTQALMNKFGWAHGEVKGVIAQSEACLSDPSVPIDKQVPHLWALITYHHVASNRAEVRRLSERLRQIGESQRDENVLIAAHTYIGLAHYSDGEFDAAERMLSKAIDAYRPETHAHHAAYFGFDTRVWAAAGRALVRWFTGRADDAEKDALQAIAWARELDHIPSLCMALLYWGLGEQARGDKQGALDVMTELLSITKRYGLPAFEGYAEVIRAWATGQVEVADAVMGILSQMGCFYCQTYYRAFAAETTAERGDVAGAIARIDECLNMVDQLGEHMYTAELHLHKARYLRQSDAASAQIDTELNKACELARNSGKSLTEAKARALMH